MAPRGHFHAQDHIVLNGSEDVLIDHEAATQRVERRGAMGLGHSSSFRLGFILFLDFFLERARRRREINPNTYMQQAHTKQAVRGTADGPQTTPQRRQRQQPHK